MNADQRHQEILDALIRDGRVTVTDLALRFEVTPETIRRDLTALDRAGALRKVHGGAVPAPSLAVPETAVDQRERQAAHAKEAIARAARDALGLRPGSTVLLDAGTSVGALARHLPEGLDLTVVTSSVLTAAALAPRQDVSVRILGGQVRGLTQAAVGPEALAFLSRLHVDVAVMGTNGVSPRGLSTPDPAEAAVKTAMVHAARRTVALADASKLGQEHLVAFAELDEVDLLVTDVPRSDLPVSIAAALTEADTEVVTA